MALVFPLISSVEEDCVSLRHSEFDRWVSVAVMSVHGLSLHGSAELLLERRHYVRVSSSL